MYLAIIVLVMKAPLMWNPKGQTQRIKWYLQGTGAGVQ